MSFLKFDSEIAKQLIGKKVFVFNLNYNDKVAFPPKVNTGLIYNGNEQTGVEEGDACIGDVGRRAYNADAACADVCDR